MSALLAIDIGGSGSRLAVQSDRPDATARASRRELTGGRAAVTAGGSTVPDAVAELVARAAAAWPDAVREVCGVGVGATGLGTLVADPAELVRSVRSAVARGAGPGSAAADGVGVAVAIDAVTAHLGALGGEAGAVVALGTGAIAIGGDGRNDWHRVDGWGHLLGDRGSGSWVGARGLQCAVRAHDGVDVSGTALLEAARRRFGEPLTWPGQLYTRADRAGVLASFAADVAALAREGDPAAVALMRDAGGEAAASAVAAMRSSPAAVIVATGGLTRAGGVFLDAFRTAIAALHPGAEVRSPAGDPLDGALILAGRAARGEVVTRPGYVWAD